MLKRRFTQFACVFLLLFAQQIAYTHAAWHAHAHAPAPAPATEHGHGDSDSSLQGDLCNLHGAFNQVLGGVQVGAGQFAIPHFANGVISACPTFCVALRYHVPLPREPPGIS